MPAGSFSRMPIAAPAVVNALGTSTGQINRLSITNLPTMISIVDYGMGNLRSVEKALEKMGYAAGFVSTPGQIADAGKLILPGVGAFGDAMRGLAERGLIEPLRSHAECGKPLFGICLGMQILFESGDEDPGIEGLGILKGRVARFPKTRLKVPHMGWNRLRVAEESRILSNLGSDPYVYFVHSYYVIPEDRSVTAATTDYGITFTAAVESGEVAGTQFHPEKSQETGMKILQNFASRPCNMDAVLNDPASIRSETNLLRERPFS